jgi:hypothetical protein
MQSEAAVLFLSHRDVIAKHLDLRQCALYGALASELSKTDDAETPVSVPRHLLRNLLSIALEAVAVDEGWYREKYPDFYAQFLHGHFESAKAHYIRYGFFEDRIPHPIKIDPEFYVREYPDIRTLAGNVDALQDHFETYGFKEGRRPYEGWSLVVPQA